MPGARGDILGGKATVGEVFATDPKATHRLGLRNVGSTVDSFTEEGPNGLTYTNVRIHAGGPNGSLACVSSPTCKWRDAMKFENDFVSAVGALNRKNGERAYIEVPSDTWMPVSGATPPYNWK